MSFFRRPAGLPYYTYAYRANLKYDPRCLEHRVYVTWSYVRCHGDKVEEADLFNWQRWPTPPWYRGGALWFNADDSDHAKRNVHAFDACCPGTSPTDAMDFALEYVAEVEALYRWYKANYDLLESTNSFDA